MTITPDPAVRRLPTQEITTTTDTELIERKFRIHGLGDPPALQKFVCGKVLYNYDNLEPSEKKLVI